MISRQIHREPPQQNLRTWRKGSSMPRPSIDSKFRAEDLFENHPPRIRDRTGIHGSVPRRIECQRQVAARLIFGLTCSAFCRRSTIDIPQGRGCRPCKSVPSEKATQIPTHQPPEMCGNGPKSISENAENPAQCEVSREFPGADGNRTHLAPLQTPHRV